MDWLSLYHSLPYPLRVIAASARGAYLRWWRYGPETERLVEEALERETWSAGRWKAWQEERLAWMLHHAATQVPYYREQWARRRRQGDRASWEVLANWTVLKKEALRAHPKAFLAGTVRHAPLWEEHTSGTTGKPLTLWFSRRAVRQWYALFEARWRGWYGLSQKDRWGILGGQLVAPVEQKEPPFWVWNAPMRQLYLSSYHLSRETISAYVQAIRHHRLVYLWGYASSLYSLAFFCLQERLIPPPLKAVISNAEPLFTHQREVIGEAFHCPVFDTYGLTESVCGASECLHGNLHLWLDAGVTEIFRDDADVPVEDGGSGRMICTGLLNEAMPLVRYEVGDRARISGEHCACGRSLPVLSAIEGRMDDVILAPDGRRIGRLDPVFKAEMAIREAQIIQETLTRLRVRLVPAEGYTSRTAEELMERLRQRVGGQMEIVLEEVQAIPRGANGKFRAVISLLKESKYDNNHSQP
ncbi:hypothetical protein [Anaerolinea sp.]|uniref:phenylacetate--CoA ligase family protein n=1 Tax=Anaerolinea sp. TaxID=1872519 RepID=UPI002ACE0EF1|nr:hypothetical protein [Anaerolinea sp.]